MTLAEDVARLERDHDAIDQETVLAATLDYAARMIVLLEPQAGGVEVFLAGLAGGAMTMTVAGIPLAGVTAALALFAEKTADAALLAWARARIATEAGS